MDESVWLAAVAHLGAAMPPILAEVLLILAFMVPFVLFYLGLLLFGFGVEPMVIRRPYVAQAQYDSTPASWLLLGVPLVMAPVVILLDHLYHPLQLLAYSAAGQWFIALALFLVGFVLPMALVAVCAYLWRRLRRQGCWEHRVFPVTGVSLQDGLLASLAKLGLPYEQTLFGIRLPSVGAHLRVSMPSWWG